jgi:hypothetical protein
MGTVWQAIDIVLRRDVAVKEVVLPANLPPAEREAVHERTMREARAAAALSHPSVVQVYDVVTEDGRPWIVMELLQARSLSEIIISDGPLSGRAVAKIGIALLGALEVAHAAGVLHRDVKPANVLICVDGRCVLTDFGVARMPSESNLTQPGMVLGSPHFIAPERAVGGKFGPPSDLFSLGVSLYTAIEGRPPFDRGDPFETMRAIVEDDPVPPVRAGAMAPILAGLLDKDPSRRWTVNQARSALRELMTASSRQAARNSRAQVGGRALIGEGEAFVESAPPSPGYGREAVAPEAAAYGVPAQHDPHRDAYPSPYSARSRRDLRHSAAAGGHDAVAKVRAGVQGAVDKVMAWPRKLQIGAAAGVVVVVAVALIIALSGGGSPQNSAATTKPSASAKPPFDTQTFSDPRGMSVNVPADWKKQSSSTYTNFVDPSDSAQRMRLNVESSGSDTAQEFLAGAERNLKGKLCQSYTRVGLTVIKLDGKPAALLEYMCGSSDGMRHGIWAAITSGGKAYHFYLTVPDSDYRADLPIYNEMVASFLLTSNS